jgi:hypothetical protein
MVLGAAFARRVFDLTKNFCPPSHLSFADCEGGDARRLDNLRDIWRSRVSAPVGGSNTVEGQKRGGRKSASLTYNFGRRCACSGRLAVHAAVNNEQVAALIRPYLSGQAFEPDTIRSMSLALKRACEEMGLRPGKNDPATRFVAEKIIEVPLWQLPTSKQLWNHHCVIKQRESSNARHLVAQAIIDCAHRGIREPDEKRLCAYEDPDRLNRREA